MIRVRGYMHINININRERFVYQYQGIKANQWHNYTIADTRYYNNNIDNYV